MEVDEFEMAMSLSGYERCERCDYWHELCEFSEDSQVCFSCRD